MTGSKQVYLTGKNFIDRIVKGERNFSGVLLEKGFDAAKSAAEAGLTKEKFPDIVSDSPFIFSNSVFEEINLTNFQLEGSIAENAEFKKCNFQYAHISRGDFSKSVFESCNFSHAMLNDISFIGCRCAGTIFDNAVCGAANFWKSVLCDAAFIRANLEESIFCETDLRNADLTMANLKKSNFWKAVVDGTCFFKSKLYSANLKGVISMNNARLLEYGIFRRTRVSSDEQALLSAKMIHYFFDRI